MIKNMADDLNDNNINNNNISRNIINMSQSSGEANNADVEAALKALLTSSLHATQDDDENDLDQIAGEYSSLNNTIDELNRYLDRWDERHKQLRAHIEEVKRENEMEELQPEATVSEEHQASQTIPSSKDSDLGKNDDGNKPV